MEEEKRGEITFGRAIDTLLSALEPLDAATRGAALRAVCDKLGINIEGPSERAGQQERVAEPQDMRREPASPAKNPASTDIRTFAQEKSPQSLTEKVALVAHYLAELAPQGDKKDSIDKEDIRRYFKQAGFPLPNRPDQTLVDGLHAGYLERVEQGRYRLSPVGDNLVVHRLPRGQGERRRSTRRRRPNTKGPVRKRKYKQ
jgi:hypothetical protein